ncbi:hypothetical protein FACS189418_3750 [Clostridia bacterium]|nr:hypothetical protein FACS189418_3750 [Clostridia bacterium]
MNQDTTQKDEAVGRRIRNERKLFHMTQEQLSVALGITPNYLGEIERGKRSLTRKIAGKICKYFGLTFDYIYNGKRDISITYKNFENPLPPFKSELLHFIETCNESECIACLSFVKSMVLAIRSHNINNRKQ